MVPESFETIRERDTGCEHVEVGDTLATECKEGGKNEKAGRQLRVSGAKLLAEQNQGRGRCSRDFFRTFQRETLKNCMQLKSRQWQA